MIREEFNERAFSDNVDRLLAGGNPDVSPSADADFRTALDFARRMAAARPIPDPRFKAALKARLLQQLAASEAKAGERNWFQKVFARPAWQTAAAGAVIVIALIVVWTTGVFRTEPLSFPPGTMLGVTGDTDKPSYAMGEPVEIEVSLENATQDPFTVDEFPPILSLMRADTGVAVYTFSGGSSPLTLAPGQDARFTVMWDQRDAHGSPATPGDYYLELEELDQQGSRVPLAFASRVSFEIRPSS